MLAIHPDLAFASDPYAPIFKALRNAVAAHTVDAHNDEEAPLDDYYFDTAKCDLFEAIRSADLQSLSAPHDLAPLREKLARQCLSYSPRIEPLLPNLDGSSFAELIESGFQLVAEAYGNGDESAVGLKEVWSGEFVWPLLACFPNAKAVVMVRDPRAVVASKNVSAEKYPWLFLARQWRKLAALAWLAKHDEQLSGRVHLVRYEDLVQHPDAGVSELCEAVGVSFDKRLLDPEEYRDGDGAPWFQNSSHYSQVRNFNRGSLTRWRDVLSTEETAFIEAICWPEMLLLGYELEQFNPRRPDNTTFSSPPIVETDDLAGWIQPYGMDDPQLVSEEMAHERLRTEMLSGRSQLSEDKLRVHLLDPSLHQPLKEAFDNGHC